MNTWTESDGRSLHAPAQARAAVTFAVFALPQLVGRLLRHLLMKEEWFVLMRSRDTSMDPASVDIPAQPRFKRVRASRRVYLADPWLVTTDGRAWLFAESFDFDASRGSIVVAHVTPDGQLSPFRSALERPYHLSYPCVFHFDGVVYMIPESGANRTLELYRAVEFPTRWTRESVLFDGVHAADPTVIVYGDRLWLFVAMAETPHLSPNDELFVFFADRPTGPWSPHPLNPVVTDVRYARPAGAMFEYGDTLIRPAQDCLRGYGHAVSLRSVDRLSVSEYEEHEMGRITPQSVEVRGSDVHTYASIGCLEAIDARRFRFRG
jgi:hypothetical protein